MDLHWQEIYRRLSAANNEYQLFQQIAQVGRELGFEYCCYGIRIPFPVRKPTVSIFDTYPTGWMDHYRANGFMEIDPTVRAGVLSNELIVWPGSAQGAARRLWSDACGFGLTVGVARSSWGAHGAFGLLTLARHGEELTRTEADAISLPTNWLTNLTHLLMSRFLIPKLAPRSDTTLTPREHEVLCWTAEGKTAYEIGRILSISERTVNFHINNVMAKLAVANKLQAVVKAIMTGLLQPLR
ncbi:MAG: autoinducer binding domain-containing protein [Rhodanobacter sp.]